METSSNIQEIRVYKTMMLLRCLAGRWDDVQEWVDRLNARVQVLMLAW